MKKKNETIYYIKGLAILSVICAHCNSVLNHEAEFVNKCSLILQNIGTLGVICFFVISGMLFHYRKGHIVVFLKKRFNYICIPWFISATCVYLYVYLRMPPLSVSSWINFVLGNGSYCYYLTMLMVFYLVFTFLPFMRTNIAFIVCEIVTVASTISGYQIGELSPYLNVLNWIGYFALGMQITLYADKTKEMLNKLYRIRWRLIFFYTVLLGFQVYRGSGGGYWKGINTIACWLGAITLMLLALMIEKHKMYCLSNKVYQMGRESFYIYIWHMPIAGIVARVMSQGILINFIFLRPIIVLTIVVIMNIVLKWMIKKSNLDQYCFILGISR